jgi:predicted phage terminase large subunit-like protein
MSLDLDPLALLQNRELLMQLDPMDLAAITARVKWLTSSRPEQLPPCHDDWDNILFMAGRGWGKSHCLSQNGWWLAYRNPGWRIAVVAPTHNDVRATCFEGQSGLIEAIPPELVEMYNKSLGELTLKNGSMFRGYSATDANRLRGPNFHAALCDEVAAWENGREVYDMLRMTLRVGNRPKVLMATTPKPVPLIFDLMKDTAVLKVHGSTFDNRANLASSFFDQLTQYDGTRIGRQELYGELLDLEEGGIFHRSWFQTWPADKPKPRFEYIVQSWDTAMTEKTVNDPTGCITLGMFKESPDKPWSAMLCDAWCERLQFPELLSRAQEESQAEFGDDHRKPDCVLIEDKGSGISLRQVLQRNGVPVRAYNPGRADKAQRAHAVSHLVMNGLIYIPESKVRKGEVCNWADEFLSQVCSFDGSQKAGMHDEYVDCLSQALSLLRDQEWLTVSSQLSNDYFEPESNVVRLNPYAV